MGTGYLGTIFLTTSKSLNHYLSSEISKVVIPLSKWNYHLRFIWAKQGEFSKRAFPGNGKHWLRGHRHIGAAPPQASAGATRVVIVPESSETTVVIMQLSTCVAGVAVADAYACAHARW